MTPYMSFLLPPFTELLNLYKQSSVNEELWLAVVQVVTKSFAVDEGGLSNSSTILINTLLTSSDRSVLEG